MVNLFWNYKLLAEQSVDYKSNHLAIKRIVKLDFLFAISDYFKCLVNKEFTFFSLSTI